MNSPRSNKTAAVPARQSAPLALVCGEDELIVPPPVAIAVEACAAPAASVK